MSPCMKPEDRERKKAWKNEQKHNAQKAFPLSDNLLTSLFTSVEKSVDIHGCDHSRRFTIKWIEDHEESRDDALEWLESTGGFCDCEVVFNSYDHWQQNK
jgi:hypothetical protein